MMIMDSLLTSADCSHTHLASLIAGKKRRSSDTKKLSSLKCMCGNRTPELKTIDEAYATNDVRALLHYLQRGDADEKVKAAGSVGNLVTLGSDQTKKLIGECGVLEALVELLQDEKTKRVAAGTLYWLADDENGRAIEKLGYSKDRLYDIRYD